MIVQNIANDPLSDVLRLLEVSAQCSVKLEMAGPWSLRFSRPPALKMNALRRGSCWLMAEGQAPRRLVAGDCFVVAGTGFTLATDPALPPVDAAEVFVPRRPDGSEPGAVDTVLLGGAVRFGAGGGGLLTASLPPLLAIDGTGPAAAPLGWMLERLEQEWSAGGPGMQALCNDLLRAMFVYVLRAFSASADLPATGWLAALAEPRLQAALAAIHADPARRWTLAELAESAGQSRSAFAERFRITVGMTPMAYLLHWRMQLAAQRLRLGREPVSAIAADLGYLSDSAFAASFHRAMGRSPRAYRSEAVAAALIESRPAA